MEFSHELSPSLKYQCDTECHSAGQNSPVYCTISNQYQQEEQSLFLLKHWKTIRGIFQFGETITRSTTACRHTIDLFCPMIQLWQLYLKSFQNETKQLWGGKNPMRWFLVPDCPLHMPLGTVTKGHLCFIKPAALAFHGLRAVQMSFS